MRKLFLFLLMAGLLFTTGCGAKSRDKIADFNVQYSSGNYEGACYCALETDGDEESETEDDVILWNLQAASASLAIGEYRRVCNLLDAAEQLCKEDETEGLETDVAQAAGEAFTNRYMMDYDPATYDKVLINTYKGIAFMALDDHDLARVEFNRAFDRQRRAVEEFSSEIIEKKAEHAAEEEIQAAEDESGEEDEESGDEEASSTDVFDSNAIMAAAREKGLAERGDPRWKPYADYVNPYATYMSGLYWLLHGVDRGDKEKAVDSLRRVAGMEPSDPVESDLGLAECQLEGLPGLPDTVWIIFENGLAPELEEFRIDIPLLLAGEISPVKMVSLALPRLKPRDTAYSHIVVADETGAVNSILLANIDRVIEAEFDANYNIVIAKAVSSMLVKAASQYAVTKLTGDIGGSIFGIITAIMTQADLRSWTALPKEVQLAKVSYPPGGSLSLQTPDGEELAEVEFPQAGSYFVFVRIPTGDAAPAVSIVPVNSSDLET